MGKVDWLFVAKVTENPVGWTLEFEDDSEIAKERRKIEERSRVLRAQMGSSAAYRQARAEWMEAYLASSIPSPGAAP